MKKAFCIVLALLLFSGMFTAAAQCEEVTQTSGLSAYSGEGKKVGILTGTIFDSIAEEQMPGTEMLYYDSYSDLCVALQNDRIDSFLCDLPVYEQLSREIGELTVAATISEDNYGFIFTKDSEKCQVICEQLNAFLQEIREDGTYDAIHDLWFGTDESKKTIDLSAVENGENGILHFAVCSTNGAPFTYMKDGDYVGADVDIAVRFCEEYGYGLKITDYPFGAMMTAVETGKADFGASAISITEERKESVLFSDPSYYGAIILIANDTGAGVSDAGFFAGIAENFKKTFIREDRWKLFLQGIGNTMLITVASVLLGSAFGFVMFLGTAIGSDRAKTVIGRVMSVFNYIVQGMPVVVLLMILYYVVFGKSTVSGTVVSIITFTVTFGSSVYSMLKMSTAAIDGGQTEASYALGFSPARTMFRIILPQASRYFLPSFKSELVSHLKATAVVGYVTVQDLTRISDIVRARTYEPFFPLIATAVIYFVLEFILTSVIQSVERHTDPKKRSAEKILKGIDRK